MTEASASRAAQLKLLLLDLLSPVRPVAQSQLDSLVPDECAALSAMVAQHRLGPLLHWQMGRAHAGLKLPTDLAAAAAAAHKRVTLRSLAFQGELTRVTQVLSDAGIAHMALKGAFLAFHAYPHPALRPLRDLDLLVPPERALEAFDTLQQAGLVRVKHHAGEPVTNLAHIKHLPPLVSPGGQVSVELHAHLLDPTDGTHAAGDFSRTPEFWQRCARRTVAGLTLNYESATDLLLHLIVHAVHDHEFDNGPLLLSDLAFLLDTQQIDWPLFWSLAGQGGFVRGCLLALQLTQLYWGPKAVAWPSGQAPPPADHEVLEAAALLMLRDRTGGSFASIHGQWTAQGGLAAKARMVWRRVFVSREEMALSFPVRPGSLGIYLFYPVRWWRLGLSTLRSFWSSRRKLARLRSEVLQLEGVRRWLAGP